MYENSQDKNLLFGVIALQSDLITMQQFAQACTLWTARKGDALADVLIEQGWLVDADRQHVEYLLGRRIQKAGGDARQTLAAIPAELKAVIRTADADAIPDSVPGSSKNTVSRPIGSANSAPQLREKITLKGLYSTGGIGQVWIAYDESLEREVALKMLKPDLSGLQGHRDRFTREAQLTGQLEHPGVVPVYEFVSEDGSGRSYYTMRFVKGRTLSEVVTAHHELLRTGSPGSASEFIKLLHTFVNICQTIAYAHSHKIIHRDLKSDNVILGDFGEVIVLDWGLAKKLDERDFDNADALAQDPDRTIASPPEFTQSPKLTVYGEKLGTPAYMAPEQALGQIDQIDERTDVYGLAAILYEILTGSAPFDGSSIVEVLERVIHDLPVPPAQRVLDVPRELEEICMRGLSKRRDARQHSALQLANEVQGWVAERAERKRKEQERERFFNLSLDLLAIVDAKGVFTQNNPAWKDVLGWEDEEIIGRRLIEFLHPDEHDQVGQNLSRILAGQSMIAVEHRCRCKDGCYRVILWNARLISGEGAIYIVGRDITERKQSEQTFQELMESAPDAMLIVNATGRIVLVNAQLERLFGFGRDELLGKPVEVLVPEAARAGHPANVARFVSSPSFRPMGTGLQLHGQRKDGSVFPVEISLSPVRTEQGLLISCAIRQTSQRAPDGPEFAHGAERG